MNLRRVFFTSSVLIFPVLLAAVTFSDWQAATFTSAQLADATISGTTADPDADGTVNLQEYVFSGNPQVSENGLQPTLATVDDTLALTYRERHDLTDVDIRLQGSDTLMNWITYNTVTEADREVFTDYDQVTLLDPVAFNNTRRFLRLRLELLPVPALRAPLQLSLNVVTPTTWSVGWTDPNTTETGYAVERLNPVTSGWDRLVTLGADTGGWTHTAADYQSGMTYRVVGIGADMQELASEPVTLPDSDHDGLPDALELGSSYAGVSGTYASAPDQFSTLGSGISDGWLAANGFDPATYDGHLDSDGDGLTDAEEYLAGTNPHSSDSDGDSMPDGWEVRNGLDPNNPADASANADGDALTNLQEYLGRTNPCLPQDYTRTYVITPLLLPFAAGDVGILGMNNKGQVIGYAYPPDYSDTYALKWTDGIPANLPALGILPGTYATGINDNGDVVGYSDIRLTSGSAYNDTYHGVLWPAAGGVIDLNISGLGFYGWSTADGINNTGVIVGSDSRDPSGSTGTFKWTAPGSYTYLQKPSGTYRNSRAINNTGSVLLSPYAVLRSSGSITDNNYWSRPAVLNNLDQAAGYVSGFTPPYYQPAFWDATGAKTLLKIPTGVSTGSFVEGLNDAGEMIGYSSTNANFATYWFNGEAFNMNNMLSTADKAHWFLGSAGAINQHGQIAGAGTKDGALMGFLLTPAALIVDANHDGHLRAIGEDMPDVTTEARPFRFGPNDNDDNPDSTTQPDYLNTVVDGEDDLADLFPVFLDIKQLLTVLPPSTSVKYKLKQEESGMNFVYTSLTRATAFAYQDGATAVTGYGPNADQAAASATTQQITAAGVELPEVFLTRIRDQDQGVILVELRGMTAKPLKLVVEKDGTQVAEVVVNIATGEIKWESLYSDNPVEDFKVPAYYADYTTKDLKWLEGKRYFTDGADKNATFHRTRINIKVKMAGAAGKSVKLKAFDVDDPTPAEWDAVPAVIDTNDTNGPTGNDNTTTGVFAGTFSTSTTNIITTTLDGNGMATVEFITTQKPGANFRIAAQLTDSAGELDALQVTNLATAKYVSADAKPVRSFSGIVSPMLTIWRKLYIEVDSMEAAPNPIPEDRVTGTITSFADDTPNYGTVRLSLSVGLPDVANRFEYGNLSVAGVDLLMRANSDNLLSNDTVDVFKAGGITAAQLVGQSFMLTDDDNRFNDLHGWQELPLDSTHAALVQAIRPKYAPAFIEIMDANAAGLNPNPHISFGLDEHIQNAAIPDVFNDSKDLDGNKYFWAHTVTYGFQPKASEDGDPFSEGLKYGATPFELTGNGFEGLGYSAIYIESIREHVMFSDVPSYFLDPAAFSSDAALSDRRRRYEVRLWGVIAHEIGHGPTSSGDDHLEFGLMRDGGTDITEDFSAASLLRFRSVENWR